MTTFQGHDENSHHFVSYASSGYYSNTTQNDSFSRSSQEFSSFRVVHSSIKGGSKFEQPFSQGPNPKEVTTLTKWNK